MTRQWTIPLPDADLNGDGTVTLDELVRSTLYIAVLLAFLLLALFGGIALAFIDGPGWLRIVGGILALSAILAALIGVRRQLRYEQAERVEREERRRRYAREDYEFDLLRGAGQRETDTHWNAARQDQYARLWLQLSYERGKPISRDEWQQLGQPVDAWNRINGLMNKRKIRKGQALAPETLTNAWGLWCDAELQSRQWIRANDVDLVKD